MSHFKARPLRPLKSAAPHDDHRTFRKAVDETTDFLRKNVWRRTSKNYSEPMRRKEKRFEGHRSAQNKS